MQEFSNLRSFIISSTAYGPNTIQPNQHISKNTKNGTIIGSDPSSTTDLHASFSNEGKGSAGKKGAFKQVHPPIGQINNESASETPTNKAKTQWSEHVWSKYLAYAICYYTPMLIYMSSVYYIYIYICHLLSDIKYTDF